MVGYKDLVVWVTMRREGRKATRFLLDPLLRLCSLDWCVVYLCRIEVASESQTDLCNSKAYIPILAISSATFLQCSIQAHHVYRSRPISFATNWHNFSIILCNSNAVGFVTQ